MATSMATKKRTPKPRTAAKTGSNKPIVITGVPGSGKTSLAAELAKLTGAKIISINDLVAAQSLFSETDVTDGAKIVLLPKLLAAIKKEVSSAGAMAVIEGHLACELRISARLVIVCRCNPKVLRKRLALRDYWQEKSKANELCEMLDYCTLQSERNFPKSIIFEIDTSASTPAQSAQRALEIMQDIKAAAKKRAWADWSGMLFSQEIDFRSLKQ